MELSLGTRGNFSIVLPVKFRGGITFRARYHGVPKPTHAWRYQVAPRASAARSEMMERPDHGRVSRWCNGRYRAGVA